MDDVVLLVGGIVAAMAVADLLVRFAWAFLVIAAAVALMVVTSTQWRDTR